MPGARIIRPHTIARELGVSIRTAIGMLRDGTIPRAFKLNGTRWAIRRDDFEAWLKKLASETKIGDG